MNGRAQTTQLLDRGHVAVVERARKNVYMGSPVAFISRAYSSLRTHGAHGVAQVSLNRVPPAKRAAMEQGRLRNRLRRALRGDALQGCFRQEMGDKGTGARRHIFSETYGVSQ